MESLGLKTKETAHQYDTLVEKVASHGVYGLTFLMLLYTYAEIEQLNGQ